jgi:hypothetical protein
MAGKDLSSQHCFQSSNPIAALGRADSSVNDRVGKGKLGGTGKQDLEAAKEGPIREVRRKAEAGPM